MNHHSTQIKIVRVYVTEADKLINTIMEYLHDELKVKGVTVLRAISGFGKSGTMHSNTLLNMSLDLPLIIEFFDAPEKAMTAILHLKTLTGDGHIVSWDAVGM